MFMHIIVQRLLKPNAINTIHLLELELKVTALLHSNETDLRPVVYATIFQKSNSP